MGRRRIVTKAVRAEIEERAEALAVQLSDGDLTREEVNDLVSSVVESALGTALEVAGAPDSVADAVANDNTDVVTTHDDVTPLDETNLGSNDNP